MNNAKPLTVSGKLTRKINFGGFFTDPITHPSAGSFELDLTTVRVR